MFDAVGDMTDAALEERLRRLAWVERRALVALLVHLSEFDSRRLYADRGQPSLFAYCRNILGYSEQGAYKRIQAARAARKHPMLLERLAFGEIHLAGIVVLAPHLRPDNVRGLLDAARGKSRRELERVAAGLSPRADAADSLRALPRPAMPALPPSMAPAESANSGTVPMLPPSMAPAESANSGTAPMLPPSMAPAESANSGTAPALPPSAALSAASYSSEQPAQQRSLLAAQPPTPGVPSSPRDLLDALSAERFLFRFSGGESLRDKYYRARDLLRLGSTTGTMEIVFERSLEALLERSDPVRRSRRRRGKPKPGGAPAVRAIPAAVRDAVWARDEGRCTFLSPEGERCPAVRWLEIDHILPFALGGRSDEIGNLRLLCRAHNQLQARRIFGEAACRKGRRRGDGHV